jgi:hypothetical protein
LFFSTHLLLLIQENEQLTKLAQGMPDTIIINYKNETDLKIELENILKKQI